MTPLKPKKSKIAVVGGGVVGLTTALVLSDEHDVTVIGERVGTLSDSWKATAIWHVYLVPETKEILYWAQRSLEKFYSLAASEPSAGVELVKGVELFRKGTPLKPTWSHIPRLFQMLTEKEIASYNDLTSLDLTLSELSALRENPVTWGYRIEAPAACMQRYLSWLEGGVISRGIQIKKMRIREFDAVSNAYDLLINCTGFGARELANDQDFVPYKGQYFVLKSSETSPKDYVGDDDHPGGMAYMIPRLGEVMVGGCAEKGLENLELTLDWADTFKRSGLYVPWLRDRSKKDQARPPVVGIRPCRTTGLRLEIDKTSASIPIIHNYGHGGSGFSLSWGCAEAVKDLILTLSAT